MHNTLTDVYGEWCCCTYDNLQQQADLQIVLCQGLVNQTLQVKKFKRI